MLRFFSGRTEAEIAQMLQVSEPTVRRDWATARLWLFRALNQAEK
jgi:DNA-directed RNA polymerase specialized sigma24 family protein